MYIDPASGMTATKPTTRNVGILCKAAMREVGVMYHHDDAAPMTRNIAVGVGEIGVLDEYELMAAGRSDSSTHITNMALQQLNMAAFQSRHLRFSNEQLREVLDMMLKKNLRSVAVQCRFATVDQSVSTAPDNRVSVAVSDDTVDVDVLPIRQLRSVAIDCRPSVFHRAVGADFVYRVDSATNTRTQGIRVDRASNTDPAVKYPAATNTDARLTGLPAGPSTDMEPSPRDDKTRTVTATSEVKKMPSTLSSASPSGSAGSTGHVGGTGGIETSKMSEVKKTSVSVSSAAVRRPGSAGGASTGRGVVDVAGTTGRGTVSGSGGAGGGGAEQSKLSGSETTSSDLARQKKRDSMLFGDVDEPPLIVAGGEPYQSTALSSGTSSTSVSGASDVSGQLMMSGRTVSEPAVSQTAASSSSSRESFICRSDEALAHHAGLQLDEQFRGMMMGRGLDSSDGDGSMDTGSVVWRGGAGSAATHSSMTQTRTSSDAGGGRQVYVTETRIERHRTGPEVTSEGSLRSIMKSSSSSEKDSSSPAVTRRKITFIDGVEQRR